MKDNSLKINSLPNKIWLYLLRKSCKMASTPCQFFLNGFFPKPQNCVHFGPYDLVQRDFRITVPAFATVVRKSFNGKFTAKISF